MKNIEKIALISVATQLLAVVIHASAGDLSFASGAWGAGRVSSDGKSYREKAIAGTANFSPELRMPVEIIYDSASEKTGIFGFAWRSPQFESTVQIQRRIMII